MHCAHIAEYYFWRALERGSVDIYSVELFMVGNLYLKLSTRAR